MPSVKYLHFFKWALATGIFIFLIYLLLKSDAVVRKVRPDKVVSADHPARTHIIQPPFSHPLLIKPDSLFVKGMYSKAGYLYTKAATVFLKDKNWEAYIWTLNREAHSLMKNGRRKLSLDVLSTALKTCREHLGERHRYAGNTFYLMGEYYYAMQDKYQSLKALRDAVNIATNTKTYDRKLAADAYQLMARVNWRLLFDYAGAEAYMDSVLMFDNLNERDLQNQYLFYYDRAAINYYKGDYDKGFTYAYKCLNIASSQNKSNNIEKTHALLALFYYAKFDVNQTISHLQLAVSYNKKSNRRSNLIYHYNYLGNAFIEIKKFEEAKAYFKNAIKLYATEKVTDPLQLSNTYASLGDIYQQSGNFDSSLINYTQSLNIRVAHFGKKHAKTSLSYLDIGEFYLQFNRPDSALKYSQLAIVAGALNFEEKRNAVNPDLEMIGNRYHLYKMFSLKADAFRQRYKTSGDIQDLHKALNNYRLADTLMYLYIRTFDQEGSKLLLSQNYRHIYEKALECTFLLTAVTKDVSLHSYAFNFMESSKNQLLLQSLRMAESFHKTGVPDSLITTEKNLQSQLNNCQLKLEEALNNIQPDKSREENIRSELFAIENKQEALKKTLQENYATFFEFKYKDERKELKSIQAYLQNNQAQLLEYFWGDSAVYLISITVKGTRLIKIPHTVALDHSLNLFIDGFTGAALPDSGVNRLANRLQEFKNYSTRARYLFNTLIEPALADTDSFSQNNKARQKLIIIPDGALAYLPFTALITQLPSFDEINYRNLHYLMADFQISAAYSVNLLLYNKPSAARYQRPEVLAFGYSQGNFFKDTDIQKRSNLEIPGSGRELEYIREVFDGKFYVGINATKQNFIRQAPDYNILHLAIHGNAGKTSQFTSRLLFNPGRRKGEDGSLYAYELYPLKLRARLVVLSACETGTGKLLSGEGVYSIARGFAYAGCPSIVISLWKVDDNNTASLMKTFYQGLSTGLPIDKALRQAQLAFLETTDELSSHPRYWAAFVPMGAMLPVQTGNYNTASEVIILIIAGAILLILFNKFKSRLPFNLSTPKKKLYFTGNEKIAG